MKTRILAGGVHTAKQQIVRIDRVVSTDYDAKTRAAFARSALKAAADCDAILLSDYGTGLVTPELAAALSRTGGGAHAPAARAHRSWIRATTCSIIAVSPRARRTSPRWSRCSTCASATTRVAGAGGARAAEADANEGRA